MARRAETEEDAVIDVEENIHSHFDTLLACECEWCEKSEPE